MSEDDNKGVSSATSIPVSEYLATSYRPDRDYFEGEVRERNLGEWDHSWVQANLVSYFIQRRQSLGLRAVTEQRVQVKATRFRVPDVCVVRSNPGQQILTRPPFLCVEVLSPEDSLSSIKDRIEDYLAFGVENIWIVDPQTKGCIGPTHTAPTKHRIRFLKRKTLPSGWISTSFGPSKYVHNLCRTVFFVPKAPSSASISSRSGSAKLIFHGILKDGRVHP